jgi:hypothetical protein
MTDITKCNDANCPIRLKCQRFASAPNPLYQSYFLESPGKWVSPKWYSCHYFIQTWDDDQNS